MQTYAYSDLSPRAKEMAYARYSHEVMDTHIPQEVTPTFDNVSEVLASWRYSEHGERIA